MAKPLKGIRPESKDTYVTLTIGRGIDSLRKIVGVKIKGCERIGHKLRDKDVKRREVSMSRVIEVVRKARYEQTKKAFDSTIIKAKGLYEGNRENTVQLRINPIAGEDTEQFVENAKRLAEETACALAQKEIQVQIFRAGVTSFTTASPTGLPPPGRRLDKAIKKLKKGR